MIFLCYYVIGEPSHPCVGPGPVLTYVMARNQADADHGCGLLSRGWNSFVLPEVAKTGIKKATGRCARGQKSSIGELSGGIYRRIGLTRGQILTRSQTRNSYIHKLCHIQCASFFKDGKSLSESDLEVNYFGKCDCDECRSPTYPLLQKRPRFLLSRADLSPSI